MVRIARPSLPAKRILLAVLALALAIVNIPIQPASAALPMTGDGYLYYATQASATTPYKNYTALTNTWSAQANMATVANATHFVRTFNSPTRNERLTMISNTNGQYEMYRWNGSAWVLDWTDTGGGGSATTYTPRFDLAYTSTGDAVAFYGSGSGAANQQVSYRRFTASTSTWGAETNFTINPNNAPGETRFLRVENRPGTDEFAVVWADYQQNLSGNYYDFSANAFSGEPATVLQNNLSIIDATTEIKTKVFDIAFESLTGELMVCYGDDGGTELNCNTRSAGTAGTWSARFQYTAMVNETEEIDMASDPASDRIAIYTMSSTARDAEAAIWSGTVWGTRSTLDATTDTLEAGTINGSVQWLRSGTTSAAVVTYDDDNALGIDWATYTVGAAGWVLQPDYAPASGVFNAAALNDKFHITTRNPNNFTHVASLIVDGNNDLSVKRLTFNGTAFTWSPGDNGAASHNANMHTSGGWSAAIAYASYLIPAVLSVDIVNASGVSVASPSYALTNIASTNVCNNTSTGYLGSATQRIRVSNGTTTPGWSLSVAATGGTAAKWTATTMTFDYNDASNGGCNDGADTDTDPGQLSFGASASGTVTPAASCTDTGVIPTSTAGFSEGTVNSVTLYNGNASASVGCYWDITLISIYQRIPAYLLAGTYSLPLTLTIVAN